MKLDKDDLWEMARGMSWIWDYCKTGTASDNAEGVKRWAIKVGQNLENARADREGRKPYKITTSLAACRALATEIQRYNKDNWGKGCGGGFGQSTLE